MKKKFSPLRFTRFYCRMENLNDLIKEHIVVVKRIQVITNFNKFIYNNIQWRMKEVNTECQIF